jgi:hypothetical protein
MGVVVFDELCALLPIRQVDPVQLHRHPGLTGIFDSSRTINAAPWGSAAGQSLTEPCVEVGMGHAAAMGKNSENSKNSKHSRRASITGHDDSGGGFIGEC